MILARLFLVLGLALAVFASPAEAARKKGKKMGGVHAHSGMVESVNHKTGTFTIKTSHHRKKGMAGKGTARKGKGAAGKNRSKGGANLMFHVHRGTKFQGGSFQTLHKGKHVVVMSQGQRADGVKIGGKGLGKPKRKKKANV